MDIKNCCSYQHHYRIWNIKSIEETISVHVQNFFALKTNTFKITQP